jgi:hypothetical protein
VTRSVRLEVATPVEYPCAYRLDYREHRQTTASRNPLSDQESRRPKSKNVIAAEIEECGIAEPSETDDQPGFIPSTMGNEYAISRRVYDNNPHWFVSLSRQRRHIHRAFSDNVYGGEQAALDMARAYRDAIMAAISPRTNADKGKRTVKREKGMSGVYERRTKKGELRGYEVVISDHGSYRRRYFSLTQYSANDALARAEAQRETWLAEKLLNFAVRNVGAINKAVEQFAEALTGEQPTALDKRDVEAALARINAEFDARKPRRYMVRVQHYPSGQIRHYVSDGGSPARIKQTSTSYGRSSRAEALAKLRDRTTAALQEFFGPQVATRFLREHGSAFEDECFDAATGIDIREAP